MGRVILGKKGQVLYVDLFYCENETLKPIIERIVKRMPRWKRPGYYKDKVIRVDYGLWIDIKKYKDYVLNM